MTYVAPGAASFRNKGGSLSDKICTELGLVDTSLDAHKVLIDAAAGGAGSALVSTKFIVGNGAGTATAVNMSGDATLANTGAVTIANDAITTIKILDSNVTCAKLAPMTSAGLHPMRVARGVYDFSVNGGAQGPILLGATLPDNAIVTKFYYDVITTCTSANDSATIAITIPTDDVAGLVAATAISNGANIWDAGYHSGIQDGAVGNFSERTTAARALTMTIGVQAMTAGKIVFFAEYVVSA